MIFLYSKSIFDDYLKMEILNIKKSVFFVCAFIFGLLFFSSCGSKKKVVTSKQMVYPKREFRGAWIHTVAQPQYVQMSSAQMRVYFSNLLDSLQTSGINAVIFQVRPQADAFYKSDLEPWSRYLTGVQGLAPDEEDFDPLEFIISECHNRAMELHAWLNPYRVTNAEGQVLASSHIFHREPWRFVKYGSQLYFDPGIPENRAFICDVVRDIVLRYDVDAIHMDDYFYPYPIAGKSFPDDDSFRTYAPSQGFLSDERDNWRRNNVNMLIKEIKNTILSTKPWVRFGISPFGIYRNKRSTPDGSGSETNGLQNYDDLYADVKLWVKNRWIDYNIPQVYWEMGHPAADYAELVPWWGKNNYGGHLYIGQDIKRTMDKINAGGESQLHDKMDMVRNLPDRVHGNCFWYGYILADNYKGISTLLRKYYHKYPALIPSYSEMYGKKPRGVDKIGKVFFPEDNHVMIYWKVKGNRAFPENARYFVVYRFKKGEKIDLDDPSHIVAITPHTELILNYEGGNTNYRYMITAVDAFHNESKPKSINVRL